MITLKISDAAGNERMQTTFVHVNPLSFLQTIPTFTPPQTNPNPVSQSLTVSTAPESVPSFGGTTNPAPNSGEVVAANFGVASSTAHPTSAPPLDPNILWGTGAMTLLGATLAG
ncbi:MAG: hypothetical protein IT310_07185 [Anaerolineales bacterium]|nr:hypothetical protein [Anaerolineales bacterium]